MSNQRIVCFGEALIDFLGAPAVPEQPRAFLQYAGGAPANVAVAVARLGGTADFVGMLGADMFGDFLLDSLNTMGVGTRYIRRTGLAPTALAFVALDARGERSFSFYRPPAADLLFNVGDFDADLFDGAAFLHVCSNSLTAAGIAGTTLAAMRRARAAGALVSFDMNLRPALWARGENPAPRIRLALAHADVVKLSREEFAFLGGDRAARSTLETLWAGATQLVIVTDGARALQWYTPQNEGSVTPVAVAAVDTTGAGDAFVGGLLFRLAAAQIRRASLAALLADTARLTATLHFAAACGAVAVTRAGAFAAMPSFTDVRQFLTRPAPQRALRSVR